MRKFLIAIAALAGVISASYLATGTPVPIITGTSGCQEANQLLNCLNSQVVALLRGSPGGVAQTAPFSVGTFGTTSAANAANATLNTQGGAVTFTGVTLAQNAAVANTILNSLITTSSVCIGTITANNAAAGSTPYILSLVPTAGTLTVNMQNGSNVSTGSYNFTLGFWCAN